MTLLFSLLLGCKDPAKRYLDITMPIPCTELVRECQTSDPVYAGSSLQECCGFEYGDVCYYVFLDEGGYYNPDKCDDYHNHGYPDCIDVYRNSMNICQGND